jgi:LacI family transcriptional regulator
MSTALSSKNGFRSTTARRKKPRAAVTLADVARHTGMSSCTVSRVLSGAPDGVPIKRQTRALVELAAKELGYAPHAAARALANGRTNVIGVFCYDIADPLVPDFLNAADALAVRHGYRLFFCTTSNVPFGEAADGDAYISLLQERRVDAMLVFGERIIETEGYLADYPEAASAVAVGIGPRGMMASAKIDYFNAGVQVGEYLASLGHRKVAFLTGPDPSETVNLRYDGTREGLARHGAQLLAINDDRTSLPQEAARRSIATLLTRHPDATAAVARDDRMALGALRALQERGIAVPEQVSLVNWGDAFFSSLTFPALTSVMIPHQEVGQRLMEKIIEALADGAAAPSHITLPMELVIRESTGPARQTAGLT